jgi:hypothetical protein
VSSSIRKASIAISIALFALAGSVQSLAAAPAGAAMVEGTGSECKLYQNGYFNSVTGEPCMPTEVISVTGVYNPPACLPGEVRCGLPTSIGGGSAYADNDGPKSGGPKPGGAAKKPVKKPEVKKTDSKKAKPKPKKDQMDPLACQALNYRIGTTKNKMIQINNETRPKLGGRTLDKVNIDDLPKDKYSDDERDQLRKQQEELRALQAQLDLDQLKQPECEALEKANEKGKKN